MKRSSAPTREVWNAGELAVKATEQMADRAAALADLMFDVRNRVLTARMTDLIDDDD